MAARGIVCQRGIEASEVSAKVCKQQLHRSSAKALSVFPVSASIYIYHFTL